MSEQEEKTSKKLTVKDLKSDQQVRWCPGCGDHAILAAVQKALVELGLPREKYAFISGIGCSSRFPYYVNAYGIHGIHGRASAIASGVKVANPDLMVWQITGDGDALAIGGNHFIHLIRRNIDINVLLFNNQIYGLTKGQYSPTSKMGAITKTSPYGTIEQPFRPGRLTLGARGKFFARTIDNNIKLTTKVLVESARHQGTSVVEILQNCVIFNDRTHAAITDKEHREDRQIILEHGKPMIFGKKRNKGLMVSGQKLITVEIGKNGITEEDILVHDVSTKDSTIHRMLINMEYPDHPVAMGVIRSVEGDTYEQNMIEQIDQVKAKSKYSSMDELLHNKGKTWEVD